MQLEVKTEVVEVNDQMTQKLEALQAQGWTLVAGVTPVAIYHLCRPVQPNAALGTLKIDESQVQIIRDGKIVTNR